MPSSVMPEPERENSRRSSLLRELQEALGYFFRDGELLKAALRHSSFAHERGETDSNERLEFLGDAVLGATVAKQLYEAYPDESEGELTQLRAKLVCKKALARWAAELELGRLLVCGKSMLGHIPSSVYADALEAVLGAVFLDGGYEAVERVVRRHLFLDADVFLREDDLDVKSRLQVLLQARDMGLPQYELLSVTGPSHSPLFRVRLRVGNLDCLGLGSSRKRAERSAAELALHSLEETECP
ncbi:MAG: ribonuclease III [Fretibacterium sp.]|nr:ribonuclease III [Fretibacterium sp.]